PPAKDQYVCTGCGTWMHISRDECPWCGTPNPRAGDPTQTLNGAHVTPVPETGYSAVTRHSGVQTVSLPGAEMPTVTLDHAPLAATAAGRGSGFWKRTYGWVLLVLVLTVIGFGVAGVLHGLQDREVASATDAIAAYERGRELLDQGQYDLAMAYFQEALRLEPDFPAAAQMMTLAESRHAAQEEGAVIPPTATPDPAGAF